MLQTIGNVLRTATEDYLNTINPSNPPLPSVIEAELLEETRLCFTTENALKPKGEKWRLPERLDSWQLAMVLARLHPIKRIAGAGLSNDEEYDLLALYQEDGPDRGTYITSDNALRKLARLYDVKLSFQEFLNVKTILGELVDRVEPCHSPKLIAVNNGIFDYDTKTLLPFTPDLVFMSKSKVNYTPNVSNVVLHNNDDGTDWDVESWMHTLSDDDEVIQLLWEILGAIIRPNVSWNKSAWFYSETGNNGKGTLCELMRQLCGDGSYASIPLSDMGKDFALEPLIRTTAIIVDENDVGTYVDKAANLKALITHDVVQINRKFKQPIPFRFYGFMVQCLNEMPKVKDKSDSFYRRQLFVPFEKCFTGVERKYIKDEYLHNKEVLEYVLHKVLNMNYYSLSEPAVCKDALDEYKEFNDPIRMFWEELGEEFVWDLLPNEFLYELYKVWYGRNMVGGSMLGKNTFIKNLSQLDDVKKKWMYDGKLVRPANRMDKPEMLIEKYDLRNWMNPRYLGSQDFAKLCTVVNKSASYRGLVRRQ